MLNFERRLPFPVEVVWSAITDPREREQWFGETTIDAREGGTIDMVATGPPLPPERKRMTGRILVWDPPHVLEHEWKQPIVEDGVVRYELTADGDGTLLRFTSPRPRCPQRERVPRRHPRVPGPARGLPHRRRAARLDDTSAAK